MAMKSRIPMRFFTMKGEEVDYDYFKKCFSTFDNLVIKANQQIPGGIEGDFIKFLLKDKKYQQGGWMVKPDGTKIRLYYLAWLFQLLLQRDNSGFYLKGPDGKWLWKPKAWQYYQSWKLAKKQREESAENERWRQFQDNVARYDPDMRRDDED